MPGSVSREELIEKVDTNLGIKPEEISADKAYGTVENRAYLKDNDIVSNIAFYKESAKEKKSFGLKDFEIDLDSNFIICPSGIKSTEFKIVNNKGKIFKKFKIDQKICNQCELKTQCFYKGGNGKSTAKSKFLMVPIRYDAVLQDLDRVKTKEFEKAYDKRYKVERRFATLVLNHGLRRCRYVRLKKAKIHITLANMACNIIRMVNLLSHPKVVAS